MLLTRSRTPLTRREAAQALHLDLKVIEALIDSGAVLCRVTRGRETIPFEQLEALFRDSLLRLYYADGEARRREEMPVPVDREIELDPGETEIELEPQADLPASEEEVTTVPSEVPPEEPIITRTSDEHAVIGRDTPDNRVTERYVPRRIISGIFNHVRFTILQISDSGMRIRHDETLQPGDEARLTFALLNGTKPFPIRARVVWTSIAQRGDGPTYCISGLRVIENADRLLEGVEAMREQGELEPDRRLTRSRGGQTTPTALTGVSDDDVASIIRAVRKFASDPIEASRWYTRAKFALSDEAVRQAAPTRAREREEVLGVWEYLERKIDIKTITGVVTWIRNTRAAATAAQ
jgi:PilZ domain